VLYRLERNEFEERWLDGAVSIEIQGNGQSLVLSISALRVPCDPCLHGRLVMRLGKSLHGSRDLEANVNIKYTRSA